MSGRDEDEALLLLLLKMRRWLGVRSEGRSVRGERAPAPAERMPAPAERMPAPAPAPNERMLAAVDRTPSRAGQGASRGSRGAAVDWVARFTEELAFISRAEARGPPPLVMQSPAVPNVGANADVVVVNTRWMQQMSDTLCGDRKACQRDLVRGIAAHEWGHVMQARRGDDLSGPDHSKELEADRTAGRILAESGASAQPLLQLLSGDRSGASLTHPGAQERVEAVTAGQLEARGGCQGQGTCSCCEG